LYQNVSILDFTGAKDDGGGGNNWSYKTIKIDTASKPILYRLDALPVAQPTIS